MRPRIFFIRHGETDWNVELRLQGQADTALGERGRKQAWRNGRRLAGLIDPGRWDFVASPLRRTCETMRIVRTAVGLDPDGFRVDPRLVEVHFGDWQGRTYAEIEAFQPGVTAAREADKWNFRPPGEAAESYAMLLERVRPWLDGLGRPTVCVTHGGVVRAVFRLVLDLPEDEAARIDVPQDRILRLTGSSLEWI